MGLEDNSRKKGTDIKSSLYLPQSFTESPWAFYGPSVFLSSLATPDLRGRRANRTSGFIPSFTYTQEMHEPA